MDGEELNSQYYLERYLSLRITKKVIRTLIKGHTILLLVLDRNLQKNSNSHS
jgi:hypothetical protein